jgi:EmrB/QacA subfamily drug resistance transporter
LLFRRWNQTVEQTIADARSWRRLLASEARRPEWVRENPNAPWFVVASVCVGAFMGQLDASIVTVALPRIAAGVHTSTTTVEWVSLSYLLVLVCALATVGRLADRLGRKLLYVDGFVVFTVGSLLCALAPTIGWLIAARVLQGLGAAMLQANSVALIRIAMPDASLGRAIGVQGTAQALGLALGPVIGGALLSLGGWRLLFLVNVPAGAIGLILGWLLLPRSRPGDAQPGRLDISGALLLAGAGGAALLVLSFVRELAAPTAIALAVVAIGCAVTFVLAERRAKDPLVDMRLVVQRPVGFGLAGALASFAVIFGVLFALPFHLAAEHVSPGLTGLELAVLPVALALAAPTAGRHASRPVARRLMGASLALAASGLAIIAAWHGTVGLLAGLAVSGAGIGGFVPANNASIMSAAPRSSAGVLSGVLNMTRALGTALGVALASLLYRSAGLTPCLLALAGVALLGSATALASGARQPPRR